MEKVLRKEDGPMQESSESEHVKSSKERKQVYEVHNRAQSRAID